MDCYLTMPRAGGTWETQRTLRVLLSAYACGPGDGLELDTGWRWATALAKAGHEVWVLTRGAARGSIEKAVERSPRARLHFEYFDPPAWARLRGCGNALDRLLWQLGAYQVARRLCERVSFDVVHHIPWGEGLQPSLLALLDVPFVFGPVGGGGTAAPELRGTFPMRGYLRDLMRDAANRFARIDPLMAATYRRSSAVLCRTREALRGIPYRYHEKCAVQLAVGTGDKSLLPAVRRRAPGEDGYRVLYVGRLTYWKGLHLGLMAFAMFRQGRPDARLTVMGEGRDEAWLRRIAWLLGIERAVTWMPRPDRAELLRACQCHDVFLFPGLHGSSGNAVLGALAGGLPVVCLDTGGPAVLVDATCGIKIQPGEPSDMVDDLAHALDDLAEAPERLLAMGAAAQRRARENFSWTRQAARVASLYRAACARRGEPNGATEVMA